MNSAVLDLDVGNSFTKWRVGNEQGSMVTGELPTPEREIARVRVSAVASSEAQLSQQILEAYNVQPEFAKTTKTPAGVNNGYEDIAQIGVDRWLALVAAWQRIRRDLIVFDFGTAMTADYVRKDGNHLGGYIVPGPNVMRHALGQSTRDVQVFENRSEQSLGLHPGRNTNDAVNFGLAHVQIGWVKNCIEVGTEVFGNEPIPVLTGGELIFSQLNQQFSVQLFPELVLEGLAIALP